jgi:hypothetical protein
MWWWFVVDARAGSAQDHDIANTSAESKPTVLISGQQSRRV